MRRKVKAVITAVTGDLVVVTEDQFEHARAHFVGMPPMLFLELLTIVLKDPTDVFVDDTKHPKLYRLFYKYETSHYILAVVKVMPDGNFFTTMYPTATKIRSKHKNLVRLKI